MGASLVGDLITVMVTVFGRTCAVPTVVAARGTGFATFETTAGYSFVQDHSEGITWCRGHDEAAGRALEVAYSYSVLIR